MYCYRHPDRETGVSCSECGRGICPDCMVFAPVGIRCPDHAGVAQGPARVTSGVRRAAYEGGAQLPGPNAILGGPTFEAWLGATR